MFSFMKNKCGKCEVPESKEDYKQLSEDLARQVEDLKNKLDAAHKETRNAEFAFDFSAVKVFSVERNWSGQTDTPVTIIGYMLNEPGDSAEKEIVREWYLYCSNERHAELVKEFKEYMKGK